MKKSILDVVHESAKGLHDKGLIDSQTMREFDAACLSPVKELTPKQIKAIRLKEKMSQPVFAMYLNISPSTIKKWETGEKHPQGAALKLLNLVKDKGLKIFGLSDKQNVSSKSHAKTARIRDRTVKSKPEVKNIDKALCA